MEYQTILYQVEDGVATITLNRPENLNAMVPPMHQEVADALAAAERDDATRVAVITGMGRAFCAGANPKSLVDRLTTGYRGRALHLVELAAERFPKPLIAAVNGAAAGGGMDMAALCDLRLASDQARFNMAYIRMGTIPAQGGCYLLPRLVGVGNALDLIWTGRTIDAQEALRIGFVQAVYPHGEFQGRVRDYCCALARGPAVAIAASKRLVYQLCEVRNMEEALRTTDGAADAVNATEDAKEGPRAWLEKREPQFKGR
ncbi:MAG: enoyl-CoA hydratase/isomerase family protein [Chloroflexi bacterium]|nr:enoyl-CoA hydratase/isomerase family protein [Chloroflexota bacterium]